MSNLVGSQVAQTIWNEKNKSWRSGNSRFQNVLQSYQIETMCYWHKDRYINQYKRIPNQEINFSYTIKWFSARMPWPFKREKTTSGVRKIGYSHTKNKVGPLPYMRYKINSKWIQHLNVKPNLSKLLKGKIGKILHDAGFGDDFLSVTSKT